MADDWRLDSRHACWNTPKLRGRMPEGKCGGVRTIWGISEEAEGRWVEMCTKQRECTNLEK